MRGGHVRRIWDERRIPLIKMEAFAQVALRLSNQALKVANQLSPGPELEQALEDIYAEAPHEVLFEPTLRQIAAIYPVNGDAGLLVRGWDLTDSALHRLYDNPDVLKGTVSITPLDLKPAWRSSFITELEHDPYFAAWHSNAIGGPRKLAALTGIPATTIIRYINNAKHMTRAPGRPNPASSAKMDPIPQGAGSLNDTSTNAIQDVMNRLKTRQGSHLSAEHDTHVANAIQVTMARLNIRQPSYVSAGCDARVANAVLRFENDRETELHLDKKVGDLVASGSICLTPGVHSIPCYVVTYQNLYFAIDRDGEEIISLDDDGQPSDSASFRLDALSPGQKYDVGLWKHVQSGSQNGYRCGTRQQWDAYAGYLCSADRGKITAALSAPTLAENAHHPDILTCRSRLAMV
jgi:hypothetical protein